jgi:four helix bundle protein
MREVLPQASSRADGRLASLKPENLRPEAGGKERAGMRDHRKLKAFRAADELVTSVYAATRRFPREEAFGITSQIRRAAVSAAANIVEGAARDSEKEYVQFLTVAFGSLREVGYYLDLACRLGYLSKEATAPLLEAQEEAARILSGLIHSLRRAPATPRAASTNRS